MLVRNATAILPRCLASVAIHVTCWSICDIGSTDGTQPLIRDFFGKRGIPGVVTPVSYLNLGQARNEALGHARALPYEYDYMLLCEAKMALVAERTGWLVDIASLGGDAYLMEQYSEGLWHWNLRLLHRDAAARYIGVTAPYLEVTGLQGTLLGVWFRDHARTGKRRLNRRPLRSLVHNGRGSGLLIG
jgi:hypothetical protein